MIHVPPRARVRWRLEARRAADLELAARNWKVASAVLELTGTPTRTAVGLAIGMGLAGLVASARVRFPPGATMLQKIAIRAERRGNRFAFGGCS